MPQIAGCPIFLTRACAPVQQQQCVLTRQPNAPPPRLGTWEVSTPLRAPQQLLKMITDMKEALRRDKCFIPGSGTIVRVTTCRCDSTDKLESVPQLLGSQSGILASPAFRRS